MRRLDRRLHMVMAVTAGIAGVVLSPLLLPVALLLHARDVRRMRALAEHFACLNCGRELGRDSIGLADAAWAEQLARRAAESGGTGIRYRIVRTLHAVCPHCGACYTYLGKLGRFAPIAPVGSRPDA